MSKAPRLLRWLSTIPSAVARVREDVEAFLANDPAARSSLEVVLVYPGLHALWIHRVSHALWRDELKLAARVLAHANRFITGVEIHPGADIGRRVVIDHGMGIVIGGTSLAKTKRHPTLMNGVVVGSNACILGAITIGERARIGSGSVVVKPVAPEATVVGVPARVIVPLRHRFDAALDHANLPDPVTDMIRALAHQNERLRERLDELEEKVGLPHDPRDDHPHLPYEGEELPQTEGG